MTKSNGSPDEARVNALYEKLTGKVATRGAWQIPARQQAQTLAYIEDACRSVLDNIGKIEASQERDARDAILHELNLDLRFLFTHLKGPMGRPIEFEAK
jgi:hypothetical protein